MKMNLKNFTPIMFAFLCGLVLLVGNARSEDEPLPPEVKKLIGMKISPKIIGKRGGGIPNFTRFSEGMLNRKLGNSISKTEIGFDEGILEGKWPVFIVSAIHDDKTLELLDARLLPMELVNWRYKNGTITRLEEGDFLIFSPYCQSAKDDSRIIFGLEDPKFEQDGYSTRIERAWEIDPQTGHIKSIPTQGIICAILGEN